MATDSTPKASDLSLDAGLAALRTVSRRANVDGGAQLLAAFSRLFECAREAIKASVEEHNSALETDAHADLFRLAQRHGLIESQSRWDTYLRFYEIIEQDSYPNFAPTLARYLPVFMLDIELLSISIRNKPATAALPSFPHSTLHS